MSLLRYAPRARALRLPPQPPHRAALSTSAPHRSASSSHDDGHGHGHAAEGRFDPPTGWLFGRPPGEKYQWEGWEFGTGLFLGTIVVAAVALAFKPDTS